MEDNFIKKYKKNSQNWRTWRSTWEGLPFMTNTFSIKSRKYFLGSKSKDVSRCCILQALFAYFHIQIYSQSGIGLVDNVKKVNLIFLLVDNHLITFFLLYIYHLFKDCILCSDCLSLGNVMFLKITLPFYLSLW